jgi:hypothetical protein
VEKEAQKCGLLLKISKKQPKVNNHPLGENSPNRVTLLDVHVISKAQSKGKNCNFVNTADEDIYQFDSKYSKTCIHTKSSLHWL